MRDLHPSIPVVNLAGSASPSVLRMQGAEKVRDPVIPQIEMPAEFAYLDLRYQ